MIISKETGNGNLDIDNGQDFDGDIITKIKCHFASDVVWKTNDRDEKFLRIWKTIGLVAEPQLKINKVRKEKNSIIQLMEMLFFVCLYKRNTNDFLLRYISQ